MNKLLTTHLKKQIDDQFAFNRGKNLFFGESNSVLCFKKNTWAMVAQLGNLDKNGKNTLVEYTTNCAIQEFCKQNQYYTFDTIARKDLEIIYNQLFTDLRSSNPEDKPAIESIAQKHYRKLSNWLILTNPFSQKIYSHQPELLEPVACSEYSAELQLNMLQLNPLTLEAPVLDIGCGTKAELVKFLRKKGIEAYGFDRFAEQQAYLKQSDWMTYPYGIQKWGSIVSNLGFSNHFIHHHLRNDGNFEGYAKKYMEILDSLKPGGSFYYAPDLPFIEMYLDTSKFRVTSTNTGITNIRSTIINRIQ